jgi:hypothetical protein
LPIDILWLLGVGTILILPTLCGTETKENRLRFLIVDSVMLFGVYLVAFQLPKVFSLEENAVGRVLLLILFGVIFKIIRLKLIKARRRAPLNDP